MYIHTPILFWLQTLPKIKRIKNIIPSSDDLSSSVECQSMVTMTTQKKRAYEKWRNEPTFCDFSSCAVVPRSLSCLWSWLSWVRFLSILLFRVSLQWEQIKSTQNLVAHKGRLFTKKFQIASDLTHPLSPPFLCSVERATAKRGGPQTRVTKSLSDRLCCVRTQRNPHCCSKKTRGRRQRPCGRSMFPRGKGLLW